MRTIPSGRLGGLGELAVLVPAWLPGRACRPADRFTGCGRVRRADRRRRWQRPGELADLSGSCSPPAGASTASCGKPGQRPRAQDGYQLCSGCAAADLRTGDRRRRRPAHCRGHHPRRRSSFQCGWRRGAWRASVCQGRSAAQQVRQSPHPAHLRPRHRSMAAGYADWPARVPAQHPPHR